MSRIEVDAEKCVVLPLVEYRRMLAIIQRYETDQEIAAFERNSGLDEGDELDDDLGDGLALPGYKRGDVA